MGTLAISAANLDTLENNMLALNNNINAVTSDIININGQMTSFNKDVSDMKNEIKTLEQEIRDFMADIRGTTLVGNAQNEILIKENELNRKYANHDEIRRNVSGLLESININLVRKNTLGTETEKILFKAPTYYLSYAFIAISSWFNNDKDKAYAALNEALKINPKKTSLLLCLVHMNLGRTNTSLKWLNKYLSLQNPYEVDNDFVILIEAITSGSCDSRFVDTLNEYLVKYAKEVSQNKEITDIVLERWKSFFETQKEDINENEFPYIVKFTDNWKSIKDIIDNAYSYNGVYDKLCGLVENVKFTKDKTLPMLIKTCVSSYDTGELDLRKDVLKNKLIVKSQGNLAKANEEFKQSNLAYSSTVDYYTLLNIIIFDRNDVSMNAKRFALSALKEIIKKALEETIPNLDTESNIKISINNWEDYTVNGSNEIELKDSLSKYVESLYRDSYNKATFFDLKIILPILTSIIGVILAIGVHFMIGIGVVLISLVCLYFNAVDIVKKREEILKEQKEVQEKFNITLENILAEIVDVHFTSKRAKDNYDYIMEYIDEYNETNYIKRGA